MDSSVMETRSAEDAIAFESAIGTGSQRFAEVGDGTECKGGDCDRDGENPR
jgi:hypothetical protein